MSKGADDETSDMEEGMTTAERRRRRRRGAGLRIPSDNVPRQSRSGPVATPVPEDPALAMSIAYAFADEPSGPNRVVDVGDHTSGLGDMDDATSIAQPPDGSTPGTGTPEQVDDVVPDGRTRQMAAVSLEALGLSSLEEELASSGNGSAPETVDVDLDDVSSDGDDFGESESNYRPRPPTIPPPLPVNTKPMEVVRAEEIAKERANTDVDERATTDRTGDRSADRTGDRTGDRSADRTADRSPPLAERTPIADRTTERNLRVEPADGVVAQRMPRAATVALSEDDLEELLEVTPPPQKVPVPPPSTGSMAAPVAAEAKAPPSAAPDAPATGTITGAEVALADDDIQEVASPSSAGDSGEILAEEIMEVEQDQRAPAVAPQATPAPAAQTPPPPKPAAQPAAPPPSPKAVPAAPPAAPKKSTAAKHAAAATAVAVPTDPEARKKRRGKPWFEEVFDEDYLRTLPFLTPQATQAEALMAIDGLGIQPGASVLDVGCGYGRHAMELAARGYHVVGVDLSLPLLLRGADEAQRRGLDINFVHADMREMDFDAQFDGAYCLFSTFGYFDDETNKKVATLICKALKPGAKLILEMLNRDYVIGDLPARVWWEGDGCVVLEEVEFNYFSSRVQSKRSVVFDDGRQVEQEISVRVYSLHEVGKLLHAAGLRVLEVSGGMAARGRFLGNRSREIIVVAERRPADKS